MARFPPLRFFESGSSESVNFIEELDLTEFVSEIKRFLFCKEKCISKLGMPKAMEIAETCSLYCKCMCIVQTTNNIIEKLMTSNASNSSANSFFNGSFVP